MQHASRGFTIFEMAMVMTIIALVISGVLIGQDMLRAAEVRSALKESGQYIEALKNFQDKYRALPGDMLNATSFWSATSNGDGNGRIITQGEDLPESDSHYEQFTAWQQLVLAGMIEGHYTGASGSGGTQYRQPGINIPSSQIKGGGWGLVSLLPGDFPTVGANCLGFAYQAGDIPPNHVLWLGGNSSASPCNMQDPVLSAKEAWDIDQKMDDGIPTVGKIVAQSYAVSGAASPCVASGAYDTSVNGLSCALVFKTGL